MTKIVGAMLRAFGRRVGLAIAGLLLAGVAVFFGGEARAHTPRPCETAAAGCDRGMAYDAATSLTQAELHCKSFYPSSNLSSYTFRIKAGYPTETVNTQTASKFTAWFEAVNTSGTAISCGTEVYSYNGTCQQRNASLGGLNQPIKWAGSGDSQCLAGCKYQIASDYQTRAVTASVGGNTVAAGTLHGGRWEYTGDLCPLASPSQPRDEENPKTECTPAANGQTYCITSNGDACATSSTGRMICWRPGETGSKTDGPITQTNDNGQQQPSPPEGSTHTSTTNVTTTTTSNTSTNTINNYTTTSGAPAGTSNQGTSVGSDGKPSGGAGTGTGGTGTGGTGDGNASGGGGDCAAAPVSSGDALLAQIAHQAWATRCAISDRNKAQDDEAANLAGQGDGLDGVTEESVFATFEVGDINENLLGSSGGTCSFGVPLELMGQPITLPPSFWSLASWIGMLVTACAYLWVARQLGA